MSFTTTDFRFDLIPFGSARNTECDHDFEWNLDDPLDESGKLPSLNSAPSSSWLIARLRFLDESIPSEVDEHNDGGGYAFEFAVTKGDSIIATFQLQGDMEGIAALGCAIDSQTADSILQQFVQILIESPHEVAECSYTIVDPHWEMEPDCFAPTPDESSLNEYGWRDGRYLGEYNVREE